MRLDTLKIRGVLAFRDEVSIDFRELPAGLIAIVGPNGGGKSTLLDSGMAAIGRAFPSRDKALVDYATTPNSVIEAAYSMQDRGTFTARLDLDGTRRKASATLTQEIGDQTMVLNADGLLPTFDAMVSDIFPSRRVLLATAFAAQNRSGSFVTSEVKERRELFADVLELGDYEPISQTAHAAVKLFTAKRSALVAVRDAVSRDLPVDILDTLAAEANRLQTDGGAATLKQRELEQTIADLEAQVALWGDATAAYAATSLRIRDIERQMATSNTDLARIDQAIENNRGLAARAGEIRDAVARVQVMTQMIEDAEWQARRDAETRETLQAELADVDRQLAKATQAGADMERTEREADQVHSVPCEGAGPFAACRFLVNAKAAEQRIPELAVLVLRHDPLQAERERLTRDLTGLRASALVDAAQVVIWREERTRAQRDAVLADKLASAETRIEELSRQRQQHVTASVDLIAASDQAHADLRDQANGNARAAELRRYLADARTELHAIQRTLGSVKADTDHLARRRLDVAAKRAQRADLIARIAALDAEIDTHALIARLCGRDGLPNLEIDAAGPTVSAYANQILAVVLPRFTVELVTQQARLAKAKDGSTHKECFDLRILDNETGGERSVTDLSGGQQVIVDEALKSALSIYANSRNSSPLETFWRDETTGALHPETAALYVDMLRRTHELGRARQTIFVTHNTDAARAADCQLFVHDGQVDVLLPPYAA